MEFLIIILVLITAIIFSHIISQKWPSIPLALYQIAIGFCLSILPLHLSFDFQPELFMVCIIGPLLFSEGNQVSRRELWDMKKPILLLAFGLVFLTVFAGGFFIHWLIPDIPLAVSFALAAIISPTDAVAVKSITKGMNIPGNIMPILEGESLLNDAAGIVAFKMATAAALTGVFSIREASTEFLFVAIGGVMIGALGGYIIIKTRLYLRRQGFEDITTVVVIQLITPFFIYMVAEEMEVSGILAVVAAGIIHGIERDRLQKTTTKLQYVSSNVWSVTGFILDGLVFVLLGFMLPSVYAGLRENGDVNVNMLIGFAFLITFVLFLVRFAWSFSLFKTFTKKRSGMFSQLVFNRGLPVQEETDPSGGLSRLAYSFLVALCGVHGTITLAIALSIPYVMPDQTPFPMRDTVIFIAAGVILISLLFAAIVLPLAIKKENESVEETLSLNEAFNILLKRTIQVLNNERTEKNSPAIQHVISQLNNQFVDVQTGLPKVPDDQVLNELMEQAAVKEVEAVEKLKDEGRISEQTFELYKLFTARTVQFFQTSRFRKWKLFIQASFFRRRVKRQLKGRWETKLKHFADQNTERIRELRFAKIIGSRAAIAYLRQRLTDGNQQEVRMVIQKYNRYLKQASDMNEKKLEEFNEQVRLYEVKTLRIGSDLIQELYDDKQIDAETAKELRTILVHEEMMLMDNDS